MSDRIELRGMRFMGRHGVHLEERMEPQPFEVDVVLEADLAAGLATDDLADTDRLLGRVRRSRARGRDGQLLRLIEALAGAIADDVLAAHAR